MGDPPIGSGCGIHPHPRPRILAHQTIPSLGSQSFNPGSCAFPVGIRPRANKSAQGLFPGRRVSHRGDECAHLFALIGRIGKAGNVRKDIRCISWLAEPARQGQGSRQFATGYKLPGSSADELSRALAETFARDLLVQPRQCCRAIFVHPMLKHPTLRHLTLGGGHRSHRVSAGPFAEHQSGRCSPQPPIPWPFANLPAQGRQFGGIKGADQPFGFFHGFFLAVFKTG